MLSLRLFVAPLFVVFYANAVGQPLTVGALGNPKGTFGPGVTVLDFSSPSNRAGKLTSATFFWSAAPCSASVKIKLWYQGMDFPPFHGYHLVFVDERGPFDVAGTKQTVAMIPPLSVSTGYKVAIAGVTSCGGSVSGEAKAPPDRSLVLPGDWTTTTGSAPGPFSASTPLSVPRPRLG